jgi:receptor protein-tyrosine kinase
MGLIETAARRLDTLARAGIEVPGLSNTSTLTAGLSGASPSLKDGATFSPGKARRAPPVLWDPVDRVELDLQGLGGRGYVTPDLGRSQLADEFRRPKRVLLHNALNPPRSMADRSALIMVTSALPGEGKTFCAINLALSMAMEVHTEVLLIDADTVRPSVMSRLGLSPRRGLTELLTQPDLTLRDVAVSTNLPRLSVLPPGEPHQQAHELFASERMSQLLLQWLHQGEHRVVVMDAPACLVSSEAAALAALAGQVVVVVRAEKTPKALVQKAFDSLQGAPLVYSILNQCTEQPTAQRYGEAYAPPVAALHTGAESPDV